VEKPPEAGAAPPSGQADSLWVYAYQMDPPRAAERMRRIRALLEEENRAAKESSRHWTARMVVEAQVTHLLIVSDNPDLDGEVKQRLEARLKALDLEYSVTVPLAVPPRRTPSGPLDP
jgi:hypothetical protein